MRYFKNYLALPLLLTIVVLSSLFLYSKNANKLSKVNYPIASPIQTIDRDGVYTNSKFGFRFEYSNKIFDTFGIEGTFPYENASGGWTYTKQIYSSNKVNPLILDINVHKYTEEEKKRPGYGSMYFEASSKHDGERISQYNTTGQYVVVGTKIADIDKDKYEGVYYQYKEISEDNRLGVTYLVAAWLKNDFVYSITVFTKDESKVEAFKPEFQNMIQSFAFIAIGQ